MKGRATVRRGSLYLDRETCDRCFPGLAAVVLQRRQEDLAILPVRHAAAGGHLLKRRNAKGDRVVTATDFFRFHRLEETAEVEADLYWDEGAAALIASGVFGKEDAP